jgi:signal transduction histidine kinase
MASFTPPPPAPLRDISQKATWPLVLVILLAATATFIIAPVLAIDWVQNRPFPSVLVQPNLLVSDANGADWGPSPQLDTLDHIVGIGDNPVTDQQTYDQELGNAWDRGEQQVRVVFERSINAKPTASPCGELIAPGVYRCETTRQLQKLESGEFVSLFVLPYGLGLVFLLIGIWVFRQRGNQRTSQVLALFAGAASVIFATYFDGSTTNRLQWLAYLSIGGSSGAILSLGLIFPQTTRIVERYPLLRFVVYVPGLILAALTIITLSASTDPWTYGTWQGWLLMALAIGLLFFIGMQVYRRLESDSPIVQQQSSIILWGSALAFLPFLIWVILSIITPTPFNAWLYMPSTILFPLAIAYAMLRYHQLNFDRLLTAGASYVIAGVLVVVVYFLIAYVVSLVAGSTQTLFANPGLAVLFVLLAVMLLDQPRQRLERSIERVFFKSRFDTQALLQDYSRRLTEVSDLTSVVQALREQIQEYFRPDVLYVYLLDVRMNAFVAQSDPAMPRLPSTATQWALDSSLPRWLRNEGGSHFLQPGHALPEILLPDQARVEMIGAFLYAPLTGHQQLNGWLALGPKQTGQIYSADDLAFLSALTNQTALALERATVFDDLERRVSELNALSRISQAVNFTLDPDDTLELIYTQTSRVIDTRNFYIALADVKRGTMRFAFYVEGSERLYPDDEWPLDTGLTGEIMRRGQPIITDDYVKECEKRGVNAGGRPGRAWMGVPLNAGNVPMGIMAVSDFREEVTYSPEQLQIFAAIADQAASVLDKGRLYRETTERARQLAVLNEIGSSITSTLDLRTVLTTIMSKAMELLNAEAGSLLLVDDQRNELVFEVTLGPAAPDLRGQRLPMNKGIVGAAAQTRRPQIVNEAQQDTRWLRDMDKSTDYSTRALLAVPMIVKDKVTGVIELLNKRGMDSFTEEDQNLLTAFAVNAAVAVDNARLFTMTDQALASRLDELSTLQEIDRQLNTSLDIKRVMELTLEWGLRVIDAKAGSIVLINREEKSLILMATHNYTYVPQSLPLDKGLAGHVARTGQPVLVNDVSQDQRYIAGCPDTKAQLSVPVKRENEVVGVINLESPRKDAFSILHLDSASRLADHAAIAITNAQLYAEVKRANDAKGKFVSEVAHELAQPVTAIKGFNDLMVKGMAGPVNDMQKQFLGTVQFNAERLNTLIKDLLDIGRIETGRLKMEIGPVAIGPIIEETIRSLQSQIDERQMTVDLNVPVELPTVLADRARLIQILTNLVSNAYKYTPTGGNMTITVSHLKGIQPPDAPRGNWTRADLQQIKLNPAGYLACAVKDTGFGIAPEDQGKLFTQFFRSQNPSVREQRGTGLGLSITKSLIELQGGAIWVESQLEKGSTFSFSMPVIENGEHEPTG